MPSKPRGIAARQDALLAHQVADVEFLRREGRALLANEPGTGKSRSAITATQGDRVLLIAPKMVLDGENWHDELNNWSDTPELYVASAYTAVARRGLNNTAMAIPRKELLRLEYDAVILDEAHYVKNRNAAMTAAVEKLASRASKVFALTGTPIPNWAHEVYTLLRLLHPQEAVRGGRFGSYWRWAESWFDCSPTRFSRGQPVVKGLLACVPQCKDRPATSPCAHYQEFMRANFGAKWRRVLRDDVLDLPPLLEQQVICPWTPDQKRIYQELKKSFMTTVDGDDLLAWSQGALNVMIDKVTTSPWVLNPVGKPRGGKLDRLAFDLTSRARPTFVLAHYNASVDACAAVARELGMRTGVVRGGLPDQVSATAIHDFKRGRLDVLCASLEKVAEGLTLTAADQVIFVEVSYKPYRNEQAKYRIHRMGQTRPVTSLVYLTPQSVDQRKRRLLGAKTDQQMRCLTAAEYAAML